jgi:phage head maturation protease
MEYYGMELDIVFAEAVKSENLGHVKGYLVRYGSPSETDLAKDYFTPNTDFGFPKDSKNVPINLYYNHGFDEAIGKSVVGAGSITPDENGLWLEAQIDLATEYGKQIARLAKMGMLGYSSGSTSHMAEKSKLKSGANEITRWPIAEASLTPTPAEHRNMVKSLEELLMGAPEEEPEIEVEVSVPMESETVAEPMMGSESEYLDSIMKLCMERKKMLESSKSIPSTVRDVEKLLRDAVGLSRTEAKIVAKAVKDLRDADLVLGESSENTKSVDDSSRMDMRIAIERLKN